MQGNITSLRELQVVQDLIAFVAIRHPTHLLSLKLILYQKSDFFQAKHLNMF